MEKLLTMFKETDERVGAGGGLREEAGEAMGQKQQRGTARAPEWARLEAIQACLCAREGGAGGGRRQGPLRKRERRVPDVEGGMQCLLASPVAG